MKSKLWLCVLLIAAGYTASAADRIQATMMQVPAGTIVVDGQEDDWGRLGDALTTYRMAPDLSKNLLYFDPNQGGYGGPDDFFFEAWAAVDKDNLYVLVHVYDQLLFHDAKERLYEGDDLELFIDANSVDKLFAATRNENCRQFMMIPKYVSTAVSGNYFWADGPSDGVKMASRLRPYGYDMEIMVPKAIFPNWKANPTQDRIGFSVQVSDSDSAGVDSHHGPMKYIGYLLSPGQHFRTSEDMAMLKASAEQPELAPAKQPRTLRTPDPALVIKNASKTTATEAAALLLDQIDSPLVGRYAALGVASPLKPIRHAALLILAKRPDVAAPVDAIKALLQKPIPEGIMFDPALVNYALVALARRDAMPVNDEDFARFGQSFWNPIKLTYTWCLGENGNAKAVPYLLSLMEDQNLRVRIKAAWALGKLGDLAALPALQNMAQNGHRYAQDVAKQAILAIKGQEK